MTRRPEQGEEAGQAACAGGAPCAGRQAGAGWSERSRSPGPCWEAGRAERDRPLIRLPLLLSGCRTPKNEYVLFQAVPCQVLSMGLSLCKCPPSKWTAGGTLGGESAAQG